MACRVYMTAGQIAVTKPGVDVFAARSDHYLLEISRKTEAILQHAHAPLDSNRNFWIAYPEGFGETPDVWFQMFYGDHVSIPPAKWFDAAKQFVLADAVNVTMAPNAWTGTVPISSNIAGAPPEPTGMIFTVHRRPKL
ncbi:hypothetical protein J2X36_000834 [Methylobacterium sp. BE186]|uniref:hypothetical protein n=1 Tax=Methylobacterium sp. BE186 TaxID=2817715 RepID=UPI00285F821D|nr:hypothetical protein [Methylobacterium sp. BE186]MDR7036098.1 hypothetical protein [Methylobacterium sp. BE186]